MSSHVCGPPRPATVVVAENCGCQLPVCTAAAPELCQRCNVELHMSLQLELCRTILPNLDGAYPFSPTAPRSLVPPPFPLSCRFVTRIKSAFGTWGGSECAPKKLRRGKPKAAMVLYCCAEVEALLKNAQQTMRRKRGRGGSKVAWDDMGPASAVDKADFASVIFNLDRFKFKANSRSVISTLRGFQR